MIADDKLQHIYNQCLEFNSHMIEQYGGMEVAAIMMAQALSIYKTALSAEDFDRMVDSISASRDQVKTFIGPVLQ
jgi:hypothetical protein